MMSGSDPEFKFRADGEALFVLGLTPNAWYEVEIDDEELMERETDSGGTLVISLPPGARSGRADQEAGKIETWQKQRWIKRRGSSNSPAKWLPAVFVAWLIPGGGHFLLKRPGRGGLIAASVVAMFLLGLMMRGALFAPQGNDLLTMVIYYGGFVGDLMSGLLYFLTVWLGYNQPDVAGHVHDYGTKFLVAAGLLNVLAMVDVFEIATGKKD